MPYTFLNQDQPVYTVYYEGGPAQIVAYRSAYSEIGSSTDTVKRIRPADLFANGTARAGTTTKEGYGIATVRSVTGLPTWGPASYWQGVSYAVIPSDADALNSRIRAKVKEQNLNLGQMFAEGRQTINLFNELAADAFRTYRYLRKNGMASLQRLLTYDPRRDDGSKWFRDAQKALANRWLQYNWGVKPLVGDLYDVANAYLTRVKKGTYRYVSARYTSTDEWSTPIQKVGTYTLQKGGTWEQSTSAKGRYYIGDSSIKTLSESGLLNLPSILWEVTPYSFVFDSLINVGEVLDSIDALAGVSSIQVQRTTRSEQNSWLTMEGSYSWGQKRYYNRGNVEGSVPMPKLQFKQSGGMVKALNLMALMRQLQLNRR